MTLSITSSAFTQGETIPKKYTCDGADLSPALRWDNPPEGTMAYALVMDDPDAPPGTWVHWVVYDLPADLKGLEEGVLKKELLENGARQGLCWGVSDFDRVGYFGPCPPPGKPHRYYFKLYALDRLLDLPPRATKPMLERAMKGHILAQAQLMGQFGR